MGGEKWKATGNGNLGHGMGPPRYTFDIFLNGGHGQEPSDKYGQQWILTVKEDGPTEAVWPGKRLMLRYATQEEARREADTIMRLFLLTRE